MIFQVFISRVFLISLDACFLPLSLHFMNAGSRLTEKHCYQISWCFNYVCRVVILQLFSLPDTTVVFTNKFCFPLFPQRQGRAVLPPSPPDTTKELKLHASYKNSDKVRPFGFLRWHMLLWLIENELFIFTALTTESVQMFVSSGLGIQCSTDEKFVLSTELQQ